GGGHALNAFLAPVFEASSRLTEAHHVSHTTEYILIGVVVALTLIIIFFAYNQYVRNKQVPAPDSTPAGGFHTLVYNKYYVDELYEKIIVKPLGFLSKALDAIIERLMIDRIVNGTGRAVTWG